jgi:hypothetical protein
LSGRPAPLDAEKSDGRGALSAPDGAEKVLVDDSVIEDLNRRHESPSMQKMRNRSLWELGLDLVPA